MPPRYVHDLVRDGVTRTIAPSWRGHGQVVSGASFSLVSLIIRDPLELPIEEFERAVAAVYASLGSELAAERRYPIRVWNFVPAIQQSIAPAFDRYMVFNAGRYAGYSVWSHGDLASWLPAASAVGAGRMLAVHCLAADAAGEPIENPRQIPAYRYSRRFGVRPPCFARATVVSHDRRPLFLVSGTASIRGEDSLHEGDLAAQLEETCENLRQLSRAADAGRGLPALTDARIYLPVTRSRRFVVRAFRSAFPSIRRVEVVPAALCRRELLVEIEVAAIAEEVLPARCAVDNGAA